MIDHVKASTFHARRGGLKNAFTYGVDFLLLDPEAPARPALLSRNRFNLFSVRDRHHGGPRGRGRGVAWFREELARRGFPVAQARLLLLTQPGFLGYHFNPVSFWIALIDGRPHAFVAEVNNTFGHRHCYFCAHPDFRAIAPSDRLVAGKLMHVSPFQKVAGQYVFNFAFSDEAISIRIAYENGAEGVLATFSGPRRPATSRSLLGAALRRPFGALRVMALIHWQALILYLRRAPFLRKPPPPEPLISDSHGLQGKAP